MLENRLHLRRLTGYLLLSIGVLGVGYLIWVYGVWAQTLPEFSQPEIFGPTAPLVSNQNPGFGALLNSNKIIADRETPDLSIDRADVVYHQSPEPGVTDSSKVFLTIPRLGIEDAMVELDVDGGDNRIYATVLTRAVAHLKNSAYPGNFGNTFLFGHSKLPILAGSDYESIFTNLPRVKTGDVVKVRYQGKTYTYQISQTGVVDPGDVFVMNQPESKQMLTLMTCIPPGFENQRYITVGELIEVG